MDDASVDREDVDAFYFSNTLGWEIPVGPSGG
jgi:hypothetical protein